MRPALLAKNPGISSKEAIAWSSKHWQELDNEVSKFTKLFHFIFNVNKTRHLKVCVNYFIKYN